MISKLEVFGIDLKMLFLMSVFFILMHAPSYKSRDLTSSHKKHEDQKKREYNQRIQNVERGVFTPLVMSTTCSILTWVKRHTPSTNVYIAELISVKNNMAYSITIDYIRCHISLSILR